MFKNKSFSLGSFNSILIYPKAKTFMIVCVKSVCMCVCTERFHKVGNTDHYT